MSDETVVITDCDHEDIEPERSILEANGFVVRRADCTTAEEVLRDAEGAVGLLTQYAPITGAVIDAMPSLRAVGRYGTGVDTIDVDAAARRGVAVVAVPDYAREEVSDHALALILTLTRGIGVLDRSVRAGGWDFKTQALRRTSSLTLGVIGLGSIGRAVAAKARALGFQVIGHDPIVEVDDVDMLSFHDVLDRSDVLTLHVGLSAATAHLIDADAIRRLGGDAYLVNTSRGGVVDEAALTEALATGQLAGAGLDVLEQEPPDPEHPLLSLPNVVVTPHAAFYSRESLEELKRSVAERLVSSLRG